MRLGAPFPSQPSAGPHHLIVQRVTCLGTPPIFPCSHAFLLHASTSCLINAALIQPSASLWLYPSTAHPWGCVLGERLAWVLCVEGRKEPSEVPCSRDAWTRPLCSLSRCMPCPRLDFIPCLCWEKVAVCAAGVLPALLGALVEFPVCHDRELIKAGPWHRLLCTGLFPHVPHQNSLSFCMNSSSSPVLGAGSEFWWVLTVISLLV